MSVSASSFLLVNASADSIAKLEAALIYLQANSPNIAKPILEAAAAAGVTIMFSNPGNPHDGYAAGENTVVWNPAEGVVALDNEGKPVGVQSAAIGLIHEMAHAIDPKQVSQHRVENEQYANESEAEAVIYADAVAKDCGETQRQNYLGTDIKVVNVTTHTSPLTAGGYWRQVDENGRFETGQFFVPASEAPSFGSQDPYRNVWESGAGFDPGGSFGDAGSADPLPDYLPPSDPPPSTDPVPPVDSELPGAPPGGGGRPRDSDDDDLFPCVIAQPGQDHGAHVEFANAPVFNELIKLIGVPAYQHIDPMDFS